MMLLGLLLLFSLSGCETMSFPDVNCLIINKDYIQCNWSTEGRPEGNYTFTSRFATSMTEDYRECPEYVQNEGLNVACTHMPFETQQKFQTLKTKLFHNNRSHNHDHELKELVKLNPPMNLTVELSRNPELWLFWNNSRPHHCTESQVRHRINHSSWQISPNFNGLQTSFSVPFPSEKNCYEFQVRSRDSNMCGQSKFWSEWSLPLFWGKRKECDGNGTTQPFDTNGFASFGTLNTTVLSLIFAVIALLILACLLVHNERRLRVILIPILPNPVKVLDDLLKTHNGNVEDWLHMNKELVEGLKPNFTERACTVCEYGFLPQTGSFSESDSSIPTDQSDSLYRTWSSTSTLSATPEDNKPDKE